jgi:HD-GYP domain-containing protein (c-di-GMP phosphodiesterase class II)
MDAGKQHSLMGERLFRALYRLVRTVNIYGDNNQLLMDCVNELVGAVAEWCMDEDDLTIQVSLGRFFLQNEKYVYRREATSLINEMLRYFEKRGLQGLRFYAEVKDASSAQILEFARLVNHAGLEEDPSAWLVQQLEEKTFPWVEIVRGPETSPRKEDSERKEIGRRIYSHALTSIHEVSDKITSQKHQGIRKVKRVVQNIVDLLEQDNALLLAMSTIRDCDAYLYTHSVNVAILSMSLGKRIGLSRMSLSTLGLCGLFHDLGKLDIPSEILNKPGDLTDAEFEEVRKHPLRSVSHIVKLETNRDLKVKLILPPFEHHLKYDLSGYPQTHREKPVSLFGRILTIADVFDALTSNRTYAEAMTLDCALGLMLEGSGKDFDPILLKVFFNMLGVYPVGTLLQLDTGQMCLVMDPPEDDDRTRPRVVLLDADGQARVKKGKVVDLAERDPQTGSFRRNILRSLNPSLYGIQPFEFIF